MGAIREIERLAQGEFTDLEAKKNVDFLVFAVKLLGGENSYLFF